MPFRRFAAYLLDWFVFAAWGGAVFLAALALKDGEFAWPDSPWVAQAIGFCLTTLPFAIYFIWLEGSTRQATIGKRVLGLRVSTTDGRRVPRMKAFLRTAIKFLPWELGHTGAYQLAAVPEGEATPIWTWVVVGSSAACAVTFLATLLRRDGRTPYDLLADTRVERVN